MENRDYITKEELEREILEKSEKWSSCMETAKELMGVDQESGVEKVEFEIYRNGIRLMAEEYGLLQLYNKYIDNPELKERERLVKKSLEKSEKVCGEIGDILGVISRYRRSRK
jgi:hypothetical protein